MEFKNQYWQSLEQLENDPAYLEKKKNEFPEPLPLKGAVEDVASPKSGNRRDFLKMLGFSVSAAALAASCEIPVKYAVPYVNKPEEIIPGIANYYASTFLNGNDFCSVLVKTREGRPIKIEGNNDSPLTKGGTSARAQASVLDLYDMNRLKDPMVDGAKSDWETVDKAVRSGLDRANGSIVLLTSSLASPSTGQLIRDFQATYPRARHVVYEPLSYAGMLYANEESFGVKAVPSYDFEKAEVIVSFGADFLGTWVSPTEFNKAYSKNRKISKANPKMSRHYQFESRMSVTGSNADYRRAVKTSDIPAAVAMLYNEVAGGGASVGGSLSEETKTKIKKAALDLKANRGKSLVVCGYNDKNLQTVINAINSALGNYGGTIDLSTPYNICQGDDKAVAQLISDMGSGRVGALLVHNCNPAYDLPNRDQFKAGLAKTGLTVSFGTKMDETTAACKYACPSNHYLESWGDTEVKKGHYGIVQPTISPLFNTRSMQDSLLKWLGAGEDFYAYMKNYWQNNLFGSLGSGSFQAFWDKTVHDGVVTAPSYGGGGFSFGGNANGAASAAANAFKSNGGFELELYQNVGVGDGRYANNPYLQETPDPVAKICWDNYVSVNYDDAKENGWARYDVLKVSADGYSIDLPVFVQPGQKRGTVSIALGYGRTEGLNERCQVGKDAYPFMRMNGDTFSYVLSNVSLEKVGNGYQLPITQTHNYINTAGTRRLSEKDRTGIIIEGSIKGFKKDPYVGNPWGKKMTDPHLKDEYLFTLYDDRPELKDGHHWGMAIDLNSCTGCSACVVACHIENNVPVVGANEVFRAHEMHWMRIDRYYASDTDENGNLDMENPRTVFMPMMCQHCDNAPCENVCPVNATNHSAEGLNQMTYNRCIGTRYCANNCPFKVRRFNWYDYQSADSFYEDTVFANDEYSLRNDLSSMVLNPDVTVRSRGVIEKCSFCVQRIQAGKLEAKKEGRRLKDGDVISACQQACPADAIVFGDMNDKESEVYKLKHTPRAYQVLEEIHVLPSVSYLTKIRNVEEDVIGFTDKPGHMDEINKKLEHSKHHGGHDDHGHGHDHSGHGHDHGKGDHGHGHDHSGHDH